MSGLCSSKDILQLQHKQQAKKNGKATAKGRLLHFINLNLNFGLFMGNI